MTNPHRKLAPFLGLGIFAGLFNAAKRRWHRSSTTEKFCWGAAIGGALGVVVALFFRAFD